MTDPSHLWPISLLKVMVLGFLVFCGCAQDDPSAPQNQWTDQGGAGGISGGAAIDGPQAGTAGQTFAGAGGGQAPGGAGGGIEAGGSGGTSEGAGAECFVQDWCWRDAGLSLHTDDSGATVGNDEEANLVVVNTPDTLYMYNPETIGASPSADPANTGLNYEVQITGAVPTN